MESDSGRCPNCREAYDEAKVVSLPSLKTDESADDGTSKKKKKKGERKKGIKLSGQERKNLQELRILQRNLVYAVGLSLDICIDSVQQASRRCLCVQLTETECRYWHRTNSLGSLDR